ncbi:hypothetical protein D3C72_1278800 [compost metagenome]
MFWRGFIGSFTPSPAAVPGISCMRPMAPTRLRARGLPPDSAFTTAMIKRGSTPTSRPMSLAMAQRPPVGVGPADAAGAEPAARAGFSLGGMVKTVPGKSTKGLES